MSWIQLLIQNLYRTADYTAVPAVHTSRANAPAVSTTLRQHGVRCEAAAKRMVLHRAPTVKPIPTLWSANSTTILFLDYLVLYSVPIATLALP